MKSILILGTREDQHVDRVIEKFSAIGFSEFSIIDFVSPCEFYLDMGRDGVWTLNVSGREIDKESIVWDSARIVEDTSLYPRAEGYSSFVASEFEAFYKLVSGLFAENCFNSIYSRACMIKPVQQLIAAKCGFLVPETLVANTKNAVRGFPKEEMIIKSLAAKSLGVGVINKLVMTMGVTKNEVMSEDEVSLRVCPHFFQEQIRKMYEIRVVVIGRDVFAFKIDSQRSKISSLDWRKSVDHNIFEPIELADEIIEKIHSFMAFSGLYFGGMDLIVSDSGDCYFVECNQLGAWAWLDGVGGVDLAMSHATCLVEIFMGRRVYG